MHKVAVAVFFLVVLLVTMCVFAFWNPIDSQKQTGVLNGNTQAVGHSVGDITGNSIADTGAQFCQEDSSCGPGQICVNSSCVVRPR